MAREDDRVPARESIERRDFLKKASGGAAGLGLLSACGGTGSTAAAAGDAVVTGPEVHWLVATSFPITLDVLHGSAQRIADRVAGATGGRFTMQVYQAGEIVDALSVMDGVEQGAIQAGLTPAYYYRGKSEALSFDTAVPFGLTARQHLAWMYHGGGLELMRSLFADFGIINFPAANTGAQFGGWFREPIGSLSEMGGVRMRIPGLGAQIMNRLGVAVQTLGAPDIYPALDRGAIDATEWVGPYDDFKLKFYEIAKNYYTPGWWEPSAVSSFMVDLDAWNDLPTTYQQVIEAVTRETLMDSVARYDALNPGVLAQMQSEHGVTVQTFSNDILEAAESETTAFLEEIAAGDATFREIFEAWRAFREQSFRYFRGNEMTYANFAFAQV